MRDLGDICRLAIDWRTCTCKWFRLITLLCKLEARRRAQVSLNWHVETQKQTCWTACSIDHYSFESHITRMHSKIEKDFNSLKNKSSIDWHDRKLWSLILWLSLSSSAVDRCLASLTASIHTGKVYKCQFYLLKKFPYQTFISVYWLTTSDKIQFGRKKELNLPLGCLVSMFLEQRFPILSRINVWWCLWEQIHYAIRQIQRCWTCFYSCGFCLIIISSGHITNWLVAVHVRTHSKTSDRADATTPGRAGRPRVPVASSASASYNMGWANFFC